MSNKDDHLNGSMIEPVSESSQTKEVLLKLEFLREVPSRDPGKNAYGREQFLVNARLISTELSHRPGDPLVSRLSTMMFLLRRKVGVPMVMKFVTAAFLVFVLILASAGVTVAAAQDSLPSQPLYGIKVVAEDLALKLSDDEQTKFELALKYINERGDEIVGMKVSGEPIKEPFLLRLQEQMTFALQLAAGLPDHDMHAALNQYRQSLMTQEQKMLQVKQMGAPDENLETAESMFRFHRQAAEGAIQEPEIFRNQIQSGNLYGQPEMPGPYGPPEEIPPSEEQKGPGPGGKPDDPGKADPGLEVKPPGGSDQNRGNPEPGGSQGPLSTQTPGSSKSPSSNSGSKGSGQNGGSK